MNDPSKPDSFSNFEKQIFARLDQIQERIEKDKPTPTGIIDFANKLLIPCFLALLALITYFSQTEQAKQQFKLQSQQQIFERNLRLQEQYIQYITSKDKTQQNSAILTLRLMDKDEVIQLANLANNLELTQPQRQQIISILCDKAGEVGCPYTILAGSFIKVLDGDTIRFRASSNSNWYNLKDDLRLNRDGSVALQLETIDSPELNYTTLKSGSCFGGLHTFWAERARIKLSETLYIIDNSTIPSSRSIIETPGYIAVATSDSYRRGIAFAFPESANLRDGSVLYLDPDVIKQSANYKLLQSGFAYPYFTSKLPNDVVKLLKETVAKARREKVGLWSVDMSRSFNIQINPGNKIAVVAFPKLLRRICDHLSNGGSPATFKDYLIQQQQRVKNINTNEIGRFDTYVTVEGNMISFTTLPEDLIFLPNFAYGKNKP
jgi:endonuclease YncB( thermonuclease family)